MTTTVRALAISLLAVLAVGCGPAPGYEPEPRMPQAYAPVAAEPQSATQLAAQSQASAGEVSVGEATNEYADTDPSSLTEFKPALDGHGAWVDDATYGTLWVPSAGEVGTDFVPYTTAGHWTYDESSSWVWASDYSWGWAPFHYGRWVNVNRHGWAWIPGRSYAGAWVTWRTGVGYDYAGWAPLGPDWYWSNGYAVGWNYGYTPYYSYCHRDHLYDAVVSHHVVRGPAAREQEGRTQPYVAANPAVLGGGRISAAPSVGVGRVAAVPVAGGVRAFAAARIGPSPSELGIAQGRVIAPPFDNAGLARARVFASPQTAVAQGAAAPYISRGRPPFDSLTIGSPRQAFEGHAPVSTRLDAVARAPQYQSVSPRPSVAGAAFATTSAPPPSFRTQPTITATPTYRAPAPSFESPSPAMRAAASAPTFRSAPNTVATPALRASPPAGFASPSPAARVIPSTPVFRGSPSVASPMFRAAPAPAPHVSTPSRLSGATVRGRR